MTMAAARAAAPKAIQEIHDGYKRTEFGVFPSEWSLVALGDLLAFQNGVNADKGAYGKGAPFANVLEVITHAHLHGGLIPGRVSLRKAQEENYSVRFGDVLFNRTSETQEEIGLASVYVGDEPVVFGGFVIRGRPISTALDVRYSGWGLRAPTVRTQIVARGQGAIRANIGQTDLRTVIVPLPPLCEQQAIAAALGDADGLTASLEQLIAKNRAIKQGTMQELLEGKRRLPGFKGEWETKAIGEVADVKTGPFGSALHERDYVSDGIPIMTVEHLGDSGVTHRNLPQVSESDRRRLSAYSLQLFDIVFSRVGSVDRSALIRESEVGWLFSGRLLRLRLNQAVTFPPFLSQYFHTELFKERVRSVAVGQTMASLNTRILGGVMIQLPPLKEQFAIAQILSDMDDRVVLLEAKLTKARQLKQGMMQELLTGRIRLV